MSAVVVTAKKLSIGYQNQVIVPDIDLNILPGKTLALVGMNGSGKTTLLKTIAGLLPPISGSLSVLGKEPGKSPSRIAYLSQFNPTSLMLPLRAIDVVRMGRFPSLGLFKRMTTEDEKTVLDALDFMGALPLADKSLNTLSGGQRQRIFLSKVLAHNAELVLLDEPTSNLDVTGIDLYNKALNRLLEKNVSVIIATHNIREAGLCSEAMLLAQKIVAYGPGEKVLTPDALLSTFGIIARMEEGQVIVVEKEHGCHEDDEHETR